MPNIGEKREDGCVYMKLPGDSARWLEVRECSNCSSDFYSRRHSKKKYCSHNCASEASSKSIYVFCSHCGKRFLIKPSRLRETNFCSRACKDKAQRIGGVLHVESHNGGLSTYRSRALRDKGCKCSECGYEDDDRMLDVHHIDGDRSNNHIDNLEVLCVWCHALETRKRWPRFRG